ncbi:DUF106 domain-containing protein [Candidatus Woesearchaeota archaeon]|nr:DUF106 domain-containing protein [Candidatus Woesearchaeota archaeon]
MAFTILDPLLALHPALGLLIISLFVSLVATLVYKYTTDQVIMKGLRDEIRAHQQKMKEHKGDPKKMIESQKKAMEANMQYMMKSLKPTLFTLIPLLLIFTWLGSHYAYEPLLPGVDFNVTIVFSAGANGTVELVVPPSFMLNGERLQPVQPEVTWIIMPQEEGSYVLEFKHDDKVYQKDVLVSGLHKYEKPEKEINDGIAEKIIVGHRKMMPLGSFKVFSWHPGWLALYIISSIAFSLGLKRILKLH